MYLLHPLLSAFFFLKLHHFYLFAANVFIYLDFNNENRKKVGYSIKILL